MSAAAATLTAAAAGVLGVALGGLLAGRQRRAEQLRTPMLEVALDLVDSLREASKEVVDEPTSVSDETRVALRDAYRQSHRALLVFGPDSAAGEAAVEAYFRILSEVDHGEKALDHDPRYGDDESLALSIWKAEQERLEFGAEREVDHFARVAGRAIRTGGRHPWLDRARQFRRRTLVSPRTRRVMRRLRQAGSNVRKSEKQLLAIDRDYREAFDAAEAAGYEFPRDLSLIDEEDSPQAPAAKPKAEDERGS